MVDWSQCKISLGADPEIAFRYKGEPMLANDVLNFHEEAPNTMGLDGCVDIAELRPHWAYTPRELVKNLQDAMVSACYEQRNLVQVKWLAGAFKNNENSIGGHIHFGIQEKDFLKMNLHIALDYFLAFSYMILEVPGEAKIRKEEGNNYGLLGDTRKQPWGIEYRTLSSWMHSPGLAYSVLSMAKHIVNQALLQPDIFRMLIPANNDTEALFYSHEVALFQQFQDCLWKVVSTWPIEPGLEDGVMMFREFVRRGTPIKEHDIRKAWGISYRHDKIAQDEKKTPEQVWSLL